MVLKQRIASFIFLLVLGLQNLLFITPALALNFNNFKAPDINIEKGIKFNNVSCTGNQDRFLSENKTINGLEIEIGSNMLQTLKADVDGNFTPNFSIQGSFDDSRFPSKQSLTLRYKKKGISLIGGDIKTSFKGATLPVNFRTLFGARVNLYDKKHTKELNGFVAQLTTKQTRDEFFGDDTRGPFFLSEYPIVENSEVIEIDDRVVYQFSDYEIDSQRGTILFKDPVEDGIKITIDYEHDRDFGIASNRIWGTRVRHKVSDRYRYGVSLVKMDQDKSFGASVAELGHQVLGLDMDIDMNKFGKLKFEMAKSEDNREDIDQDGRLDDVNGQALEASYTLRSWQGSVKGRYERYEPSFKTVAESISETDRELFDIQTSFSRHRAVQLFLDLKGSRNNVEELTLASTKHDRKIEGRILNQGSLFGKGYELTVRHKIENQDEKDEFFVSTETREELSSAQVKMRFRKLLTGFKVENRKIDNYMDPDNSSKSMSSELSFRARISEPLITSLRLEKSTARELHTGIDTGDEFTGTFEVDSKFYKNLTAKALYTIKDRDGQTAGKDTSASLILKTGEVKRISADAKYELKRSEAIVGTVTGSALVGAGISFSPNDRVYLRAFYEKRGTDGDIEEDRSEYGIESSFKAKRSFTIKGELKRSVLKSYIDSLEGYRARSAYLEAMYRF